MNRFGSGFEGATRWREKSRRDKKLKEEIEREKGSEISLTTQGKKRGETPITGRRFALSFRLWALREEGRTEGSEPFERPRGPKTQTDFAPCAGLNLGVVI